MTTVSPVAAVMASWAIVETTLIDLARSLSGEGTVVQGSSRRLERLLQDAGLVDEHAIVAITEFWDLRNEVVNTPTPGITEAFAVRYASLASRLSEALIPPQ